MTTYVKDISGLHGICLECLSENTDLSWDRGGEVVRVECLECGAIFSDEKHSPHGVRVPVDTGVHHGPETREEVDQRYGYEAMLGLRKISMFIRIIVFGIVGLHFFGPSSMVDNRPDPVGIDER